jgi:hypothetical protein
VIAEYIAPVSFIPHMKQIYKVYFTVRDLKERGEKNFQGLTANNQGTQDSKPDPFVITYAVSEFILK